MVEQLSEKNMDLLGSNKAQSHTLTRFAHEGGEGYLGFGLYLPYATLVIMIHGHLS